jgi:hypothetical protein
VDKPSYFDAEALAGKIRQLERQSDVPVWLCRSVEMLRLAADEFPCREDEDRFVVEYVYPH